MYIDQTLVGYFAQVIVICLEETMMSICRVAVKVCLPDFILVYLCVYA